MRVSPAYNWRKYKEDFLRANHCTDQQFHDAYVAFMEGNPGIKDYQKFARRYHITIHASADIPADMQVVLSVNISAIKVMALTYEESLEAINEILGSVPND